MRTVALICLLLFLLPVIVVGAVPFKDGFADGKLDPLWQVHCSPGAQVVPADGRVEIRSSLNAYSHISRPLGEDLVTASARIKPSIPAGVTWCTSLFVAWSGGNWCQMGMIEAPGGGGRFYAVETVQGETRETYLTDCDLTKPHYVRIQLGKDCIRYFTSDDGSDWKLLRAIERPAEFAGAPAKLIAGKGYGRGAAPYAGTELDNSYTDLGVEVTSEIADVRVDRTNVSEQSLSKAERKAIEEVDLDPVGKIVLQGKADPTYEQVSKYYPPMLYPREAVSVPEHPLEISVDHLGRLERNHGEPPVAWLSIGDPPVPFGDGKTEIKRRLLDDYLPVLILTTRRGAVDYEQTVFGWSEGLSADKDLYTYVRLRARSSDDGKLPRLVSLMTSDANERMDFATSAAADGGAEVCLRFPWPKPAEAVPVIPEEFDAKLAQASKRWRAEINAGACFDVPDKRVNEAYRAWIGYSRLLVDKVNGFYEPHDGAGFYEVNYGYSVLLHCIALDQYGMHDKAALYLDSVLHFQQSNGLYTQDYGLPDQGMLLTALAEHYNLTGDKAWLKRVAGNVVAAGNWLIEQRKLAPKQGLTKGLIKYRPYCDYPDPEYNYYSDTYCCTGLEKAAAALSAVGMKQDAARFGSEARRYRADILASMDAAAIRRPNRTLLPMVPDTQRLLKASGFTGGEYYGLVASCLLDSGFLPASDKRAYWITDLMEQKKGLRAGLCRFGPDGVDHAYTYGYLMTELERGDPKKVLLGFWSMLAYGMTRDTYSGVECTSMVTGANYWTLPHLYSCTQQLRLLRNMILREDGSALRIGDAIPRAWLENGKKINVRRAATTFGDVSLSVVSAVKSGRIRVQLTPPTRLAPKLIKITLRHPAYAPIRSVRVNGKAWKGFTKDSVELSGVRKAVAVEVSYR